MSKMKIRILVFMKSKASFAKKSPAAMFSYKKKKNILWAVDIFDMFHVDMEQCKKVKKCYFLVSQVSLDFFI